MDFIFQNKFLHNFCVPKKVIYELLFLPVTDDDCYINDDGKNMFNFYFCKCDLRNVVELSQKYYLIIFRILVLQQRVGEAHVRHIPKFGSIPWRKLEEMQP
jgi:hypothetical protein